MANKNRGDLIRIYGVTLANAGRIRPYGHGMTKIKIDEEDVYISYVDYFIEDLIALIKQQKLEKRFIKEIGIKEERWS